ncbi:MAG: hypothetical protein U0800_18425 [Isosphaeraceae bacterium]
MHRQLKAQYGPDRGGRAEVTLQVAGARPRIDAIGPDGELIEIQSASLSALRAKLKILLDVGHRVRVVKPVAVGRHVTRRDQAEGPDRSSRRSPWKGSITEAFPDLMRLARIFPRPGLSIELLAVTIDEVRIPRPRRRGYAVIDRRLIAIDRAYRLEVAADLWGLLPGDLPDPFTTLDLAARSMVRFGLRGDRLAGIQGPRFWWGRLATASVIRPEPKKIRELFRAGGRIASDNPH